jgi:ABC-type sugar transport system ATPase subunit
MEERERRKVLDDPGAGAQRVGLLAGMTDAGAAIADAGSASAPRVRVTGVGKAFGETQALRDASFELLPGEVHAIVGENGSGKSTLVKILTGVHAPDAGEIEIAGASARALGSPRAARELGIATVFQEVLVAEARSVLDNVWLGHEGLLRTRIATREKRARARDLLGELLDRELDLDTAAEELSLSDRQACCIVRALLHRPRVLMLDGATSALDVATRDRLFAIARRLSGEGVGIVFITHRMDEILEIGDRITVMRSGETVATLRRGQWTPDEVVELMSGTGRLTGRARERALAADERRGEPVLSAQGVRLRAGREPIDVEIHAGELVGVAGLEGHGQGEFLDALRGALAVEGQVLRHAGGRTIAIDSTTGAADNGIAYVPRERRQALFGWMSIRENFGLPTLTQDARGGWLRNAQHAQAPGELRGSAGHRPRAGRRSDHHAQRRQPAEGRDRALAGRRPAHPAPQRPDARHRLRRQARPLRPAGRARPRRRGRGHALLGARRARRAHGSRARLARAPGAARHRSQRPVAPGARLQVAGHQNEYLKLYD